MNRVFIAFILVASSALAVACAPSAARPATPARVESESGGLTGRYVLFMRRIGSEQPDSIEFRPDGTCVFDMAGRTDEVATCHVSPDGDFTLTAGSNPLPVVSGKYQRRKYSFRLVRNDNAAAELFYVRWPLSPKKPHPPESDVLGIQSSRTDLGTIAQELTPDHGFRMHGRDLVQEYRAYYDFQMEGRFSYANGIITYRPSVSNALEQVQYLNDFVVSRDDKCLWIVDPFHDSLECVTRAPNLDLGPPPDGFREGPRP